MTRRLAWRISCLTRTPTQGFVFVDYGLWPFDDRDYVIVCTVTINIGNIDLSLWTPLFSENARCRACVQYSGRCGLTEHSLRWCPVPFKKTFSPSTPISESTILTGLCLRLGNYACINRANVALPATAKSSRRNASGIGRFCYFNREHNSAHPGNNARTTHDANHIGASTQPGRQTPSAPSRAASGAPPVMKYWSSFTGYTNPSTCQQGALQVQPTSTP